MGFNSGFKGLKDFVEPACIGEFLCPVYWAAVFLFIFKFKLCIRNLRFSWHTSTSAVNTTLQPGLDAAD